MSAPEALVLAISLCVERRQPVRIFPQLKSRLAVVVGNYTQKKDWCSLEHLAATIQRLSDEVHDG